MDCRNASMLLQPCFDGELDEGTAAMVRAHVAGCTDCSREMAALQALRTGMQRALPRYAAPAALRARLGTPTAGAESEARRPQPRRAPPWLAMAASLLVVAGLSAGITRVWLGPRSETAAQALLLHDLVSSHLRALAATNSLDVPSSDRHTVRPWFAGRVEVAPPAVDLSPQGFDLAGGRVDYVGGRRVAVLVYKHAQHTIDVFVVPDDLPGTTDSGAADASALQGLNVLQRRVGGVQVWAISDLDRQELAAFADGLARAQ